MKRHLLGMVNKELAVLCLEKIQDGIDGFVV